jgi:hypothetical protein
LSFFSTDKVVNALRLGQGGILNPRCDLLKISTFEPALTQRRLLARFPRINVPRLAPVHAALEGPCGLTRTAARANYSLSLQHMLLRIGRRPVWGHLHIK